MLTSHHTRLGICLSLLCSILLAAVVLAVPFHAPEINGVITPDTTDWDPADLIVNDIHDDVTVGTASNIRRLWSTWTADTLYLAVTYQDFDADNALRLYLDIERGVGPNSAQDLDFFPGNFTMPQDHRFELVIGRDKTDGSSITGPAPTARLAGDDSGTTAPLAASVNIKQGYNAGNKSADPDPARYPLWNNVEIAIPWSALYPGLGSIVPPYAVIKAVAIAAVASADSNGIDSAPDNSGIDGGPGNVLLANLAPSVVDTDGDGAPDPANASISGTTTLPQDPRAVGVTVTAEIINFAGRDPGAPLSRVTTLDTVRTWKLERVPAGTYRIRTTAPGYFFEETTVTVAQGEQQTGLDQTLEKATAVRGGITFASGPGRPGTVTLLDADLAVVATRNFTLVDPTYVFYLDTSGQYTVRVQAPTYLDAEQVIQVTAGQDVNGVDLDLIRQTEVSGTVSFLDGPGEGGTVQFLDDAGVELASSGFTSSGGPFQFFTPTGGVFTVSANTNTISTVGIYVPTDTTVTVTAGNDVTGLALELPLAARITGSLAFEGPDAPGRLELYNNTSGALRDTLNFSADGDTFGFYLGPGEYRLELAATGYSPQQTIFQVSAEDSSLGVRELVAVRATHLVIIDDQGNELPEARATYYDPVDPEDWVSQRIIVSARDENELEDIYDLDGELTTFNLSSLKMDDQSPPTGNPVFYGSADKGDTVTSSSFSAGRDTIWMSNTAVEVLRIYLAQPNKAPIAGRLIVAFQDPRPNLVVVSEVFGDTLVANTVDTVTVFAQLYDSARNPSTLPDVPVTFGVANTSSGQGQFAVPTVLSNSNGIAWSQVTASRAGVLDITATVVIDNRTLEVEGGYLGSGETVLKLTAIAGPTHGWRLSLPSNLSDLTTPVSVTGQLIDLLGNPTKEEGRTIDFSADPATHGSFNPVSAVSDTSGRASSVFTPSGLAGLVTILGTSDDLVGGDIGLKLRDVAVIPDPVWYEEPPTRQTFDKTDLTALVVANTPDELLLEIPYTSDWNGMQIHVIFETGFDAAGASKDPFEMPVNYGQAQKPDYALTIKYSVYDYGDFRKWNTGTNGWDFWNPATVSYSTEGNVLPTWVTKDGGGIQVRIPWAPFGGSPPDSMQLEAYLTQDDGEKRSAFDSAPLDSTLNLTFDYNDPGPGDWESAKGPVTLENYGPTYVTKTDFPAVPLLTSTTATPSDLQAGEILVLSALVADGGDGIGDVLADLSEMGGGSLVRMHDDGDSNHGDETAGDGQYSLRTLVPITNPGGSQVLTVSAFDGGNVWAATDTAGINVTAIVEPIVLALDPIGDDHGPNQPNTERKFYTYPTNIAFVKGGFDLTGLTVFETKADVGGTLIDMIAFQVSIVDFPNPADEGTANWNPLYADLNIQKLDILIDSAPGGAINTLPNRQAAFQPWDAWDFAIIMDGWYKALIPSLGQNTVDAWRNNALRTDQDIMLLSDWDLDTITALVSKAALGDPTPEDIQGWDIAVCMASHDFGGEEVLGGIRWVNEGRGEWQFGGGQNGDRDPNLIDLLLVPGEGHTPGKTQEEILDYESTAALDRLDAGLTPVAIEMSGFEDTGPPVIDTGGGGSVVTKVDPLADAPLALAFKITDDNLVGQAEFRYRSTGFTGVGFDRTVPMGYLGRNNWIVDILPSWLDSNLVYSPIDSTRYLEFEIYAEDIGDPFTGAPPKTSVSPVTTLQISPNAPCRPEDSTLDVENLALLQIDGSGLVISEPLRRNLVDDHFEKVWTGDAVDPDTMSEAVELQWDICNIDPVLKIAPTVPQGQPLGIFRQIFLATADSLGGYLDYSGKLPGTAAISLHYPQAWLAAGLDEDYVTLYEYHDVSQRWVLVGGNVSPAGNNVTATINHTGIFGLFVTDAVAFDAGEVLSGVTVSPNPFSPNGDGLYDEVNISFYLTQEASVTAEIYNINGDGKQTLIQNYSFSGDDLNDPTPRRVPGLTWDGRDNSGNLVPYGIYVIRLIATYNQAGGTRSVRSNHTVAVIR